MSRRIYTTSDLSKFTVQELVSNYHEQSRRQRTVERNLRLRRYQGRNSGITVSVLDEISAIRVAIERELIDNRDAKQLAGLLFAEHNLADRISEARDNGFKRPELRARLSTLRRALRHSVAFGADQYSEAIAANALHVTRDR